MIIHSDARENGHLMLVEENLAVYSKSLQILHPFAE